MIKKALCTALAATMLFSAGCSNRSKNEQKGLTFYCTDSGMQGTTVDIIKRYNKYCKREGLNDNIIKLVQFDSEKLLYDKLSTETMAGGGPDLISTEQELPYEKMIENKAFCDLNEMFENDSEINLADYNRTILDAGVFDGKRYLLPAFFGFDYMVADKEMLDKFDISYQQFDSVTYENFGEKFKGYFNNPDGHGLFNSDMWRWGREDILRNFIGNYVDVPNKTCDFSSDEFKTALDTMTKAYKLSEVSETDDYDPITNSSAPIVFPGFSAEFFSVCEKL